MAAQDSFEINPGEQLRELLQKLIPFEPSAKMSFIERIDNTLIADGEFARLAYASCLNYLIRRLITTSEFLKRKYSEDQFRSDEYRFRSGINSWPIGGNDSGFVRIALGD